MKFLFFAVLVALAAAASARAADPAPKDGAPDAQAQARFALLKSRFLSAQGIPASAAGSTLPPPPSTKPGIPPGPPPDWHQEEDQRRGEFDKQFGAGSYDGIIGFSHRCLSSQGCDKLATADIIGGAYKFVDLQKDASAGVVAPGSDAYERRHSDIKSGMRAALEDLRPGPNGATAYQSELIRVSDPIVKKIFTPAELLDYARRNATSSDSAPYYAYLGRTLNAAGAPREARDAFDAALARDAKYEPALSGRAESNYKLGDYPAALGDARSALTLDPTDAAARATMKFSEGRVPADAGAASSDAPPPAASAAAASSGLSPSNALAAGGDGTSAVARSAALAVDARKSLQLGDARAAEETLARALALDPTNASALSLSAVLRLRRKDYAGALAAAEAGLKLAPNSEALLVSKAMALGYMKDWRGQLSASEQALALNPNDPVARFARAAALRGLGEKDASMEELRAAAIDPKFAAAARAAIDLPNPSDIMFLFPGDAAASAPAATEPAPVPSGPRSPLALLGIGLGAGLLLAIAALSLTRRPAARAAPPRLFAPRAMPALIGGKYRVGAELGSGGMGVVYEGEDASLGRAVAVKRLREELRADARERARFVSEAKLVARLKHPNVVEIYAIVEDGGEVFLVFERVNGRSLADRLAEKGPLPFPAARDLFRGVLAALEEAHKRAVIHRDLKPSNVMLEESGRARVMDFGIARLAEEAVARRTRTIAGTPAYMAPEQEQGVARPESDLYSLAACLYETLTGRTPFEGSTAGLQMNKYEKRYPPASSLARLPAGIDEFFSRAFEPSPEKRYPSAREFLRALESLG